ncbi:hypothetical protein SK36_01181 [Citrobacter sp. MGH106]|nr:hypothetical protein SK36_01181 [Citrobacter sp. MGH106]
MGCSIKNYIMGIKMYRCSLALKFSGLSVKKISELCFYSSQQAFTRYFKECFGTTPVEFRSNSEVIFGKIPAWGHKVNGALMDLDVSYIYIPHLELYGVSGKYECDFYHIGKAHTMQRAELEKTFSSLLLTIPDKVYTLCKPVNLKCDKISFDYHIGVTAEFSKEKELPALPVISGDYLRFTFTKKVGSTSDRILYVYKQYMAQHCITRRDGHDIELFEYTHPPDALEYTHTVYVPVLFDEKLIDMLLTRTSEPS